MPDALEVSTALYSKFDPAQPLKDEGDPLYLDWQARLGGDDVKRLLAKGIALGAGIPECRFLTGHRGVGKTTELYRVKAALERGDQGRKIFVSMLKAEEWLDLSDIGAQDVIFQVVRQLIADLEGTGMGMVRKRWSAFLGDVLARLRKRIDLEGMTFDLGGDAGGLGLDLMFKQSPDARIQLREVLDPRLPTLFDLINAILKEARTWLRDHGGFDDILVVVDELDRIPQRYVDEKQGVTNHLQLFLDQSGTLRGLGCDVIYTVPIELAYSTWQMRLQQAYSGAEILGVPLIPIAGRDGGVNGDSLELLMGVVSRRAEAAGLGLAGLFEESALCERLCILSGGHLRQLVMLVRAALEYSELREALAGGRPPIDQFVLDRSVLRQALAINRGLSTVHWEVLLDVHKTKRKPDRDDSLFFDLLRDLYIFMYEDEYGTWYDWNPMLSAVPGVPVG